MTEQKFSIETVKPSDFNIKDRFCFSASPLRSSDKEEIARNIVIISLGANDTWLDFSWERYQERCGHTAHYKEREVLDELVRSGHLSLVGDIYSVEDHFVMTLKEFIGN